MKTKNAALLVSSLCFETRPVYPFLGVSQSTEKGLITFGHQYRFLSTRMAKKKKRI